MNILGILVGVAIVIIGLILKKRTGHKTWYILTITGSLICATSILFVSTIEVNPISDNDAIILVEQVMESRKESASVIILTGSTYIENEHCITLSAGSYSTDGEKYSAMYHYAVSDSGTVYYIDVLQGADWIRYR